MVEDLILHEDPRSGNCYKIKLTAALLGIRLKLKQYDILKGETRTAEFTSNINANGRIPVLQIHGSNFLPESNAACWYLAQDSMLIPAGRFEQADMLRWMFFEQYSHEPNIATLRFWLKYIGREKLSEYQSAQLMPKRVAGREALQLMESHLARQPWFVGDAITLADIALFAYTHVAEEGGLPLTGYPHILTWIERVRGTENFIPMD